MKNILIGVRIHDLNREDFGYDTFKPDFYPLKSIEEVKCKHLTSLLKSCLKYNDIITQGKIIAEPVYA